MVFTLRHLDWPAPGLLFTCASNYQSIFKIRGGYAYEVQGDSSLYVQAFTQTALGEKKSIQPLKQEG